jgi:ABC-type transport system involved in multi-copper enzyme maturation permease subunit
VKLAQVLTRLDSLQRGKRYRIVASIVVLAIIAAAFTFLWVRANEPGIAREIAERSLERARAVGTDARFAASPIQALERVVDSLIITINPSIVLSANQAPGAAAGSTSNAIALGLAVATVAGALIAIVWLGLSLTYLGLLLLGWGIGLPLMALGGAFGGIGQLIVAATPLALAFLTGMELLRLALSGPWPVVAVARNVLAEAVRMKISLVFIVLLLLMLSYVPGALMADQPLRYRVQQWLQYGMGLSYTVLALLTLFLSAATVSFEQRDRVIWQTMTKPVHPWQYVLGKWIGVMSLNVVLLGVTAGGVFMFTEYLRHQPAQGEIAFNVREDGSPTLGDPSRMVEDRRLLDTQVLVARVGRFPEPADVTLSPGKLERLAKAAVEERRRQSADSADEATMLREARETLVKTWNDALRNAIEARVTDMLSRDPSLQDSTALRERVGSEILMEWETIYRSVPLGQGRPYLFTELPTPSQSRGQPMTLRYKINAGSNDPAKIFRVMFDINGRQFERQVALNAAQTLLFDSSLVEDTGMLEVTLFNAPDNEREISFEPDGLEVLYSAGGYEINFLRIVVAMWIKLGFVAAVGIAVSTFLSFPVACVVAGSILFMAESASYLNEALEHYTSMTKEGIDWVAVASRAIAVPVGWIFSVYSELSPTENLVDGRLVPWHTLFRSMAVLGGWTLAILGLGWAVFSQRELATYSGR